MRHRSYWMTLFFFVLAVALLGYIALVIYPQLMVMK